MTSPVGSDVEVEWQLDALDLRPVERWLAARTRVSEPPGGVHTGVDDSTLTARPRPAERLVDTYMDTGDWRVGRSGFVLRVRHRGGRGEVTLKGRDNATHGLRRRLEVTEPLPAGGLGALGRDGPVGWRLHALLGKRPLQTVLEVRTRRRPFDLCRGDGRIGEVALDDTTVAIGKDQPLRLQRVEVEVDPSMVDEASPIVETLRQQCGLQPATLSKFEAGLLAAGREIPAPPDLGPTALGAGSSVGDVAFAVLRRNLGAMLAHEAGTRLGEDPEELHDMRVATRRMRAALSLFSDALPVRARHVRTELGWLADALGAVRDLDVQLERLREWADDAPEQDRSALEDLADLLARERAEARTALLACVDSARYERLVGGFTAMLRQGPSRRSAAARAPAAAVVPELVHDLHRRATKAARRARRSGSADDHHRTRIRAKRLRYALEFVSEIYDGRTAPYVRHVVRLQDNLGEKQDARVAAERLHDLVSSEGHTLPPMTVFVMGGMAQHYRLESDRLARKVPRLLHELRGPAWRKLTALMEQRRLEIGALYRWPPATPGSRTPPRPAPSVLVTPHSARPDDHPADGAGADAPPHPQPEPDSAEASPAPSPVPSAELWQGPAGHPSGGPGTEPLGPVPSRNGGDPRLD